eukprot:403344870
MTDGQVLPQYISQNISQPSLNVETNLNSNSGVKIVNITAKVVVPSITYTLNMNMQIDIVDPCIGNVLYSQNQSDKVFTRNSTTSQRQPLDKFILTNSFCEINCTLELVYFPNMTAASPIGITLNETTFELEVDFLKLENIYQEYRATISAQIKGTSIIKKTNQFDIYIFEQQDFNCSTYNVTAIYKPQDFTYDLYSSYSTPINFDVESKCFNQTYVGLQWLNGSDPQNTQFWVDKNDSDYSLKIYSTNYQILGQTLTMFFRTYLNGKSQYSGSFKITIADNYCSNAVITPTELVSNNFTAAINQTDIALASFVQWSASPYCGSLKLAQIDFFDGMNIYYNTTISKYVVSFWSDDFSIQDGMHFKQKNKQFQDFAYQSNNRSLD